MTGTCATTALDEFSEMQTVFFSFPVFPVLTRFVSIALSKHMQFIFFAVR